MAPDTPLRQVTAFALSAELLCLIRVALNRMPKASLDMADALSAMHQDGPSCAPSWET